MMKKLTQDDINIKHNRFAKYYDFAGLFLNVFIGKYRERLLRNVKGKVLEIGVGTGANFKYYSDKCEIYGVDMSKEMLKRAKKKADQLGITVHLEIGNAEKLHFRKGEFDFVVDTLGLCTYINPIRVIKEIKRVCKSNGKILLLEHGISNNNIICKLQEKREPKHYWKTGCSLLKNHEELVRKAGLKIIKIERKLFGIIYIIGAESKRKI